MNNTNFDCEHKNSDITNTKSQKMAYFYVVIAAILWGTLGIFSKNLNKFGFNPLQIVFIRAFGASITLLVFTIIKDAKLIKVKPHDYMYFIGTGIFSFTFFNLCYFIAIKETSLSVAAILLYTAPTIVTILSAVLFKEKMTNKKLISLLLTFVGCIFVTAFADGTENKLTFVGILAGLGAGLGYALYSIFGRYALIKYSPITVTLYTFIFSSIGLIAFVDIKTMIHLFSNVTAIYNAVVLGLFATVLPFLLYTKGLYNLETSQASIVATIEPIIATIIGFTLYSEAMTFYKVLGISIVVFAVSMIREK